MEKAAESVRNGDFAKEWLAEDAKGRPNMNAMLKEWANHPLEIVGKKMRKMSGVR
jgi:ketol-acid reductoisomerase